VRLAPKGNTQEPKPRGVPSPFSLHNSRLPTYDPILVGRVSGTDEVQLVGLIRGFAQRKTAAVVVITERNEVRGDSGGGADEMFLKPVNPNALLWAVDKHVSR